MNFVAFLALFINKRRRLEMANAVEITVVFPLFKRRFGKFRVGKNNIVKLKAI